MVTYSHKCLVEEVVVDHKDHNKERVYNMLLKLLLKKSIRERPLKLQLTEIEFVMIAKEKVERMELIQHVMAAEEEDRELK